MFIWGQYVQTLGTLLLPYSCYLEYEQACYFINKHELNALIFNSGLLTQFSCYTTTNNSRIKARLPLRGPPANGSPDHFPLLPSTRILHPCTSQQLKHCFLSLVKRKAIRAPASVSPPVMGCLLCIFFPLENKDTSSAGASTCCICNTAATRIVHFVSVCENNCFTRSGREDASVSKTAMLPD